MSSTKRNEIDIRIRRIIISVVLLAAVLVIGLIISNKMRDDIPKYDMQSPARIGPVTLTVSDLPTMSEFYQEVIGFQLLQTEGDRTFLTADGKTQLLILEEEKEAVDKPVRTTGLYHFALLLPDQKTLGQYLVHLSETGYLQGAADHQYSEALYLMDPEGNGIEIYADRPSEEWIEDGNGGYVGGSYQLNKVELLNQAKNAQWTGLPATTRMGHMHLQVADLVDSEKFYVEVLGFDVVAKSNSSHLFVSKDGYHHHIGMNIWGGKGIPVPPANAKGLKDYTIYVTETEWKEIRENLLTANIHFEETEAVIGVNDPSGIGLKIITK